MRGIVTGGRDYADAAAVQRELDHLALAEGLTEIAHGGARGADQLAGDWACANRLPCFVYPAEWKRLGRGAGPKRNAEMLRHFAPDVVIAFPGGRGTADMVARARKAGVRVIEVT